MIRLRRPVVLSPTDGPFVPAQASLDEIDERWRRLCESNPAYYDGPCWHVLGVHRNGHGGAMLHVMESSFRFGAVQEETFDVGFRGLGVRAITWRGERVLLGRRSPGVARYAGLWEFVPAGTLEPGVEPAVMIMRELDEEVGVNAAAAPGALAVLFDPIVRAWQIAFKLELSDDGDIVAGGEHDELRWFEPTALPPDLAPIDVQMRELI